jgi:diguanylate cyclase (GGDEF)-like protein
VGPSSTESADSNAVAAGLRAVLARRVARFQHEYPCHGPAEKRWFSVRITPAEIDGTHGAVINHVDVSAMHRVQQVLSHQTMHDDLTGLPNRLLLTDRLDQALADAARHESDIGVVFLDLDHFKRINDSLGHNAGDDLLVQVTERLQRQIRGVDTLCRYSGDEFVIVWRDLSDPDEATLLSARLTAAFVEPFLLGDVPVNLTASIGVAVGRRPQSAEELLQAADMAMYEAKRHGRDNVRVFTEELRQRRRRQMVTEVDLRGALKRAELVLHYQPVINLDSGLPTAVEALVRWQHPTRGLLGPGEFLPVVESTHLIKPLTLYVLDEALRQARAWLDEGDRVSVAVNLAAAYAGDTRLPNHVAELLARHGVEPALLEIELTETAVLDDPARAKGVLEELSALGVRLSVDDFGTGYASIAYLTALPIDTLKIDQSFILDLELPGNLAITRYSIELALGLVTVAEGVETEASLEVLDRLGCDEAQGFLFSRPLPADECIAFIRSNHQVAAQL